MSPVNAVTDLVNRGGPEGSFGRPRARAVVLLGILFLFFFQMLSDFVAGLYGLGLRHTSIPPEIASMGLLLSPLLLGLFPKCFSSRQVLTGLVFCILVARVLEVPLSPHAQMLVSGTTSSRATARTGSETWKASWRSSGDRRRIS